MICTIVPTLNEELHIARAVSSVVGLGPVLVVDSGSNDRTQQLAEAAGAMFIYHPWSGYSAQKNWAMENLSVQADWVFLLDADEWITPQLADEIRKTVEQPEADGYYVARRNIFLKRELKHAWWYPDYQMRLFRVGKGRYENREVHEHVEIDGTVGFLKEALLHENVKGIDEFMRRHEKYAMYEAREIRDLRRQRDSQLLGKFFGSWPERRRALKVRVWYRLPGRPAIRFIWMYVIRRGFLDGRQGLIYSQLIASYEALIDAKLLELEMAERNPEASNG